jgi:hypothetical protein
MKLYFFSPTKSFNMKKSELYAKYDTFNRDIEEIDMIEFYENFVPENKEFITFDDNGSTHVTTIQLDGCKYMKYASHWNVGWQGDIDGDEFYCKMNTMTEVEREELRQLFTSDAF